MPKNDQTEWLVPVPENRKNLLGVFRQRNRNSIELSVAPSDAEDYVADGWSISAEYKKTIRIKKEKSIGEKLKDRFWCTLYKLGYTEMNACADQDIVLSGKSCGNYHYKIDVFSKDDETAIVALCRSCSVPKRKSMEKELLEFSKNKGAISLSIKSFYGNNFKPKILWFIVTENIIWSESDLKIAGEERIRVLKESDYRYLSQIVEHLGSAARPQFLAEYLGGVSIPEMENIRIPAIRGSLNGKKFYSFVITPEQLLKIAFVNHRALNDPDGAPTYQRLIQKDRLKEISAYIASGGFFPNSILINFRDKVRFDLLPFSGDTFVQVGYLYLPSKYKSAWVIDGQHRLYAFGSLEDKARGENLIVVAFDGISHPEEANLFVTINHKQKKVAKNLLDGLEGELNWGSSDPKERMGAVASRLINLLNGDSASPFYQKISIPGMQRTESAPLTIPDLKKSLLSTKLLGREEFGNYIPGALCAKNDKCTLDKSADSISAYFRLFAEHYPERWQLGKAGYLCSNIAVGGAIRFLGAIIDYHFRKNGEDPFHFEGAEIIDKIRHYVNSVFNGIDKLSESEFAAIFKPVFGSGGVSNHFYKLCDMVSVEYDDFVPPGYEEWLQKVNDAETQYADDAVRRMQKSIQDVIVSILQEEIGDDFLEVSVKPDILADAYKRSLEAKKERGEDGPLYSYMNLIDFKTIIIHKDNWPFLKNVFNIEMEGDKGLAKNLRWFDKLNSLRRISAHSSSGRNYKPEDIVFLRWLDKELTNRIG